MLILLTILTVQDRYFIPVSTYIHVYRLSPLIIDVTPLD